MVPSNRLRDSGWAREADRIVLYFELTLGLLHMVEKIDRKRVT